MLRHASSLNLGHLVPRALGGFFTGTVLRVGKGKGEGEEASTGTVDEGIEVLDSGTVAVISEVVPVVVV